MNKLIIISFSLLVLLASSMIAHAQEAPELVLPIGHTARVNSVAFSPEVNRNIPMSICVDRIFR